MRSSDFYILADFEAPPQNECAPPSPLLNPKAKIEILTEFAVRHAVQI